jgi:glutamate synthase (ferredoxin)
LQIADAIENEKEVSKAFQIYNVDRAVCGRVAGVIAKKYGDTGFAGQLNITYVENIILHMFCICLFITKNLIFFGRFRFNGSAGQSFGCFLTPGMNIRLVGEANDYVGKVLNIEPLNFLSGQLYEI